MNPLQKHYRTYLSDCWETCSNLSKPSSSHSGGSGKGSARKSRLDIEGDSDAMETTGDVSCSKAAPKAGIMVAVRATLS